MRPWAIVAIQLGHSRGSCRVGWRQANLSIRMCVTDIRGTFWVHPDADVCARRRRSRHGGGRVQRGRRIAMLEGWPLSLESIQAAFSWRELLERLRVSARACRLPPPHWLCGHSLNRRDGHGRVLQYNPIHDSETECSSESFAVTRTCVPLLEWAIQSLRQCASLSSERALRLRGPSLGLE